MPKFYINGSQILPNNANCPVEVVSASTNATSADFFKHGNNGKIEITGVTDQGYQLVTPIATVIDETDESAFGNRLKINGVTQKYSKKGLAPLGTLLTEQGAGTYYIRRYADGSIFLLNSNYDSVATLSTAEQKRKVFTIMLQAGGGGGGGASGWNWFFGGYNGGGGGGGGCAIGTLNLYTYMTSGFRDFKIVIGSGGGGGSVDNSGGSGGQSAFYWVGSTPLFYANGGSGAGHNNGAVASGGGAGHNTGVGYDTSAAHFKFTSRNGGNGGAAGENGKNTSGSDVPSFNSHIIGVNGTVITTGNHSGGGIQDNGCGGGGGASVFGNGGYAHAASSGGAESGGTGAGGAGGDAWNNGGNAGARGGDGRLRIYY